jgi:hypothetical protein
MTSRCIRPSSASVEQRFSPAGPSLRPLQRLPPRRPETATHPPWQLTFRASAPLRLGSHNAATCAGRFTGAWLCAMTTCPRSCAPHEHCDGGDPQQNHLFQTDPECRHQPGGHSECCSAAQQGDRQGDGAARHAGSRYAQCGQYRFFHEFSPVGPCGSIPVRPL